MLDICIEYHSRKYIYIYIPSGSLWLFNIAMENGPFIDGLPIKNGDFPWLCAYLSSTELTELSIQVTQNDSQATTIGSQLLERGPSMCVNVCQCMSINVCQCTSMYVNQCTSMYVNVCQSMYVNVCQSMYDTVRQCMSISVRRCTSMYINLRECMSPYVWMYRRRQSFVLLKMGNLHTSQGCPAE